MLPSSALVTLGALGPVLGSQCKRDMGKLEISSL